MDGHSISVLIIVYSPASIVQSLACRRACTRSALMMNPNGACKHVVILFSKAHPLLMRIDNKILHPQLNSKLCYNFVIKTHGHLCH